MSQALHILVLRGGPDRERGVSLRSGAEVAAALRAAGHRVTERDVLPGDLSALDIACDVVFPILHGRFGEGGPLQELLEQRGLRFVGCRSAAARDAMDKLRTKQIAREHGIATADSEALIDHKPPSMAPPLVIKPVDEGSSVGVHPCHDQAAVRDAMGALAGESHRLMAERLVSGREMTVGIIGDDAMPVIEIVPAAAYYDYAAKYDRDDTAYRFDIDLPPQVLSRMQHDALKLHRALQARHLSRVDFIVDADRVAWLLEINTAPGFTTHSLLPMAARRAGLDMPALCDRLVRLARDERAGR